MSVRPTDSRRGPRPAPRSGGPTTAAKGISPARAAAFEILLRVATSDAHSDDLLHAPAVSRLSQEDHNLATALVLGVLRWQIALDARIGRLLTRPAQRLADPVSIALRMGGFQLLHMNRIPAHAAIHESVELCRAAEQPHATGMVNAVLREIGRGQSAKPSGPDAARRSTPLFESPGAIAQRLGHPAWLVERWVAQYGRDAALAVCEYDQHEPPPGGWFSRPLEWAQIDDGSRLVAELAAAAARASGDEAPRVWDCCAAPGGKTLALAERLPSARILATDISERRLAGMQRRIAKAPHTDRIRCELADATKPGARGDGPADALFDLILCDAPCSGTGTLARNPEIRHRLAPEDLARQAARQQAILRGAMARLRAGGRLLYSTCSLEPEENEQVVAAVLADTPEMHLVPLTPVLRGLADDGVLRSETVDLARTALREGCLRTLPGIHPCDGFYAALLERN